jgi:hypothetical protein
MSYLAKLIYLTLALFQRIINFSEKIGVETGTCGAKITVGLT